MQGKIFTTLFVLFFLKSWGKLPLIFWYISELSINLILHLHWERLLRTCNLTVVNFTSLLGNFTIKISHIGLHSITRNTRIGKVGTTWTQKYRTRHYIVSLGRNSLIMSPSELVSINKDRIVPHSFNTYDNIHVHNLW